MTVVTLQGLLFTALGFAWKDGKELINVIGVVGIVVSGSAALPMHSAHRTILALKEIWDSKKPNEYDGPDVIGYYRPRTLATRALSWLSPWRLLPLLFTVSWIAVMWINFGRFKTP